jgi:nucleoside-diphosphate-sugar epimerase
VFEAARQLGIKNVVWAYSLSKLVGEEIAKQFCRWDPQLKIIGLRFSNIMEPHDYSRFPGFQDDARKRKWNFWGYIDARDAAQAVRLCLESNIKGAELFIIASADTVMERDNESLLKEVFPSVPHERSFGPHARNTAGARRTTSREFLTLLRGGKIPHPTNSANSTW